MDIQNVPWESFRSSHFRWRQSEHVSMIGPTGGGKTTLATELLLPQRDFVTILEVKPKDRTMAKLLRRGYQRQREFIPDMGRHLIVWPRMRNFDDMYEQRDVFANTLSNVFGQGGWTLFLDELSYLTDLLGLDRLVRMLYHSARSTNITIIAGTQRPAFVPLAMYDQPHWLFFWNDNDERNLKRIGNVGGMAAKPIMAEVASLQPHEILAIHTRKKLAFRTLPPKPE